MEHLDAKERFDRVNDARKTLATILGGAAFLVGGFFTWQNLKVAQENLKISQEGQITDRFGKAIEQLGAVHSNGKKKLEVRLGGIYALEGIANESKELHWPIMEVLCTYVRENAPLKRENSPSNEQEPKTPAQENQVPTERPHPAADIQAILSVLGRRDVEYEERRILDLSDTYLRGAAFRDTHQFVLMADRFINFRKANLRGADLSGVNLRDASLDLVDLREATLRGVDFRGVYLFSVAFNEADLTGADLSGVDLREAGNLTQKQIAAANGDRATQLPKYLDRPESWKK